MVHDLAVLGAEALIAKRRDKQEAIGRLIARSIAEDPGFDREVLDRADVEAWRPPPDE